MIVEKGENEWIIFHIGTVQLLLLSGNVSSTINDIHKDRTENYLFNV